MSESRRDERIAGQQAVADGLIGKTIMAATVEPHDPVCDGSNLLRLTMSDGSVYTVLGTYGDYTGRSCDEYVELLQIELAVAPSR